MKFVATEFPNHAAKAAFPCRGDGIQVRTLFVRTATTGVMVVDGDYGQVPVVVTFESYPRVDPGDVIVLHCQDDRSEDNCVFATPQVWF